VLLCYFHSLFHDLCPVVLLSAHGLDFLPQQCLLFNQVRLFYLLPPVSKVMTAFGCCAPSRHATLHDRTFPLSHSETTNVDVITGIGRRGASKSWSGEMLNVHIITKQAVSCSVFRKRNKSADRSHCTVFKTLLWNIWTNIASTQCGVKLSWVQINTLTLHSA